MLTRLYPMVQFQKGVWEIDEFDNASMYLIEGTERAMLIDCGMGIGDLRGAVEMITDKPLYVVITHGHIDHTGNARQFDEIWLSPDDQGMPIPDSLERRRQDVYSVAQRQKGAIGYPYTMFNLYPFDINTDLREPAPDEKLPVIHDLAEGTKFDLGGGRIISAYACPGHTAGEMVLLDEQRRTLYAGDAVNFNLFAGAMPVETTLKALKRVAAMADRYDAIYNGHHDFRAQGMPLDGDCLPTIIDMLQEVVDTGRVNRCVGPNPWGQVLPLTFERPAQDSSPFSRMALLRRGRNFVSVDPEKIYEQS